MEQRKTNLRLGNDTHVRDYNHDIFRVGTHAAFETLIGSVLWPEPEPIWRQTTVTVEMARGGRISQVAFPNAACDFMTGSLHGVYEGPIPGQMVMVGFENGNRNSPYIVNRYPYQGVANSFTEFNYLSPMFRNGFHFFDVVIGHFSGAYISFNTGIFPSLSLPGSISIDAVTDIEMSAINSITMSSIVSIDIASLAIDISSDAGLFLNAGTSMDIGANVKVTTSAPTIVLDASLQIELNGNTNWAIKFTEMQTAFNLLKTELNALITVFNAHVHTGVTTGPGSSATSPTPATPATADMSTAKNTTVLM